MIDSRLLEILVCPLSHAPLVLRPAPHGKGDELWCAPSGLAYPIHDGIPVMLPEEARELTPEERESLA